MPFPNPPKTWVLGELVTAPLMNTQIRDALIAVHAGELAITGQTAGDLITAASGTQLGRLAAVTAGRVLVSAGVNLPPAYSPDLTVNGSVLAFSAGSPTLQFPGTGNKTIDAANALFIETNSVARLSVSTSAINAILPLQIQDGTPSLPGLHFSADTNTGIWRSAADQLQIVTGGFSRLAVGNAGVDVGELTSTGDVDVGGTLTVQGSLAADLDTLTAPGVLVMDGPIRKTNEITVTLSGGTINNWSPIGFGNASRFRVLITADTTITGIAALPDGTEIILYEPGAGLGFSASFTNEDAGSFAANRIQNHRSDAWKLGATGLANSRAMRIIYSGVDQRWINLESDLPSV